MILMLLISVIGIIFAVQGISMHSQVGPQEDAFHALQTDYFNNSKAVRDAAPTGSELTAQLAEIQNFPSTLMELKLIGIGKTLTGIFFLLFGILLALMMMPIKLGYQIKTHMSKNE